MYICVCSEFLGQLKESPHVSSSSPAIDVRDPATEQFYIAWREIASRNMEIFEQVSNRSSVKCTFSRNIFPRCSEGKSFQVTVFVVTVTFGPTRYVNYLNICSTDIRYLAYMFPGKPRHEGK